MLDRVNCFLVEQSKSVASDEFVHMHKLKVHDAR